ncbi:MAG TPA: DUF4142 domain-containing protein [Caulobacteraceae bacterium]|jgi:putative membrane protein
MRLATAALAAMLAAPFAAAAQPAAAPNDAQIAHIAFTAGTIDIDSARQALQKTKNAKVRDFAQKMVRDHSSMNNRALALVKKLKITPEPNATSTLLGKSADARRKQYSGLPGDAFDRGYVASEVAYHKAVNAALRETLIPDAKNPELKGLLQTGLKLFEEHQAHAEQLASELK